jgi:hypothetical protein
MTAFPSSSELGRIETAQGYSYQLKPDDILWLARAVYREGGDNAATIWTYFQRQALNRRSSSLASLVQGHSQAINPNWATGGIHCRPGGDYYGRPECSASLLARRDANIVRPWDAIPTSVRQAVVAAAQGRLPNNAPRATDFADQTQGARFLRNHADSRLVLDRGNIYIAEGGAVNWPAGFVRITYQGQASSEAPGARLGAPSWLGPVLGATAFVGVVASAWALTRSRR